MKVITISGKARAGKDSLANILSNLLSTQGKNVHILHYADELKWIAQHFYHWDGEKDAYGRTLLQTVGDIGRLKNENYWVNSLIDKVDTFIFDADYIIIADCRYPNEIKAWGNKPHLSIYVERPTFENDLTKEQQQHSSENALNEYTFDVTISAYNLGELEKEANKICEKLKNEI